MVPEPVPGGGPMNAAVAAARLGAPSAFVGRVSTDRHGDAIWHHLESNGVDLRACERGPEPTAQAMVEHVPRLVFRFGGDGTADTRLGCVDLGRLGPGPHILHGGTLGLFRGRTADSLAELVERHDGLVSLDPNVRPRIIDDRSRWERYHSRWLERTHVYRGSDEDFEWIWPGRGTDSCAEELLARGVSAVLVTRGADGAVAFTRAGATSVPGQPVEVVDSVGAGDTFVGSVLASLWERGVAGDPGAITRFDSDDWREIVGRAVAAAAITCSRAGADPPFRAELEA